MEKSTIKKLTMNGLSEYNRQPSMVLVHNPVSAGAIDKFAKYNKPKKVTSDLLFRYAPKKDIFAQEYDIFVEQLKDSGLNIVWYTDLLTKAQNEKYKSLFFENPNFIYTRDSVITMPWESKGYILSNMKEKIRKREPEVTKCIMDNLGLTPIIKIPDHLYFEGGDVIPIMLDGAKTLLIGYDRRTQIEAIEFLQKELIPTGVIDKVIGFKLAEWRINLDGCFVPIDDDVIVAHLGSIVEAYEFTQFDTIKINPQKYFTDKGFKFVLSEKDDSIYKQSCNIFCAGNRQIFTYNLTDAVNKHINNIKIREIPGSELVLGRGGPRCMTGPIY